MKITAPQDKENFQAIEEIVNKFEKEFINEPVNQSFYHLVIEGEYPRELLDKIQQAYLDAGWAKAICKSSSETNERPGLTGLKLWNRLKVPNNPKQ